MASKRQASTVQPAHGPPTLEATPVADSPSLSTPTDDPLHLGKHPVPLRAIRKRVFEDGDHVLLAVSDGATSPKGSLLWIPGVPKFAKRADLDLWLKRTDNKSKLLGHQVAHVKFVDIYMPTEAPRISVTMNAKRKIVVNDPGASESEDA